MFSLTKTDPETRRSCRKLRHVPRHLPPHLMRDIGRAPWPDVPGENPTLTRHIW